VEYTRTVQEIRWEELPPAVRAQAKRCLKDVVGTAAGSMSLPAAARARALVCEQFGSGRVPLWFQGCSSTFAGAAFCNALCTDSLDSHDGFRPNKGRAGATVVPVALAACSLRQVSGAELLAAVAIGYEVACRAGLAVHRMYAPLYHGSGSWAALGAAAAGARILSVPAHAIDRILGAAEYYAPMSPILRCTASPSIVKDGAGAGAWAAAMALAMQRHGLSGLPSLFAAESAGREQAATLGDDWMILRQYFKLSPTCRWTHPPVEAVVRLRTEHGFQPGDIERIEVETFEEAGSLMSFPPADSDGAQYNLPWAVAAVLVDGTLGVEQILPQKLTDPDILALGRRVTVRTAADIQSRFPAECLARVSVILRNGRRLSSPTTGARGDYTDPASDEELGEKFSRLAGRALGAKACAKLARVLDTIEERPARDLLRLL